MFIVGLTGGIASGKSFVIKYLKKLKIPTHESDKVVRLLYQNPSEEFINYLNKEGFGNFITKKQINKKKIRDEVFKNKNKRKKLEKFLHKRVEKERNRFIKKNREKNIVFIDIPLLFEKKLEKEFDFVCSVMATLKEREKRALKRPGMNNSMFRLIVKNQVKDRIRKLKSNYIINTSATKTKTCLQVDNIIYDILNKEK
jgi:dephospho-CoA kinase